jgi:hypothetical protein
MPVPLRARIGWTQGRLFRSDRANHGWVLQTTRGLLGPSDLLRPGEKADRETVVLEVAGAVVPLVDEPVWTDGVLALIDARVDAGAWPERLIRRPEHSEQPEDCIAIADAAADPLPLAASRLSGSGESWRVDRSVSVDGSWHGAVVVSRASGVVIGILVVDDEIVRVALVAESME